MSLNCLFERKSLLMRVREKFFALIESLLLDGWSIWVYRHATNEGLLKVLLHLRWLLVVLHLLLLRLVHRHASRLHATLKARLLLVELLLLLWYHGWLALVNQHCRHLFVIIEALVTS